MSLLIKGMQMPRYCQVCPFSIPLPIQLVHDGLSSECVADSKRMKVCTDQYERSKRCPLMRTYEGKTDREKFQYLVFDIAREHAEKGEDIQTLASMCADLVIGVYDLFNEVEE